MKVLSIKEPYATLIKNKKKKIETRSWKTSYRGELYIHASINKNKKEIKNDKTYQTLIKDIERSYGYIICKCNLVDCIYMTKEYIENIKKTNYQEYICGEYKEGRYAWVLENIIPIENKIKAKGQLNIWNFYSELEIMNLMEQIEYGWLDKNNKIHKQIDDTYTNNYKLQSPKEIIKNKIGVCWDQVELERYYFKKNDWNIKTYFIVHYTKKECPTHTFLTFEKNNKYYWFEHSWEKFKGIHEYNSKQELLKDIRKKFIKQHQHNIAQETNIIIREYSKPEPGISVKEFFKHCESGKIV